MFSNIFKNSKTSLFEMFEKTSEIDKNLPMIIEDYILNGNNSDVLLTLRKLCLNNAKIWVSTNLKKNLYIT